MALLRLTYSGNVYDAAPAGTIDFPLITKGGKSIPYLLRSHIHVYRSGDLGLTWTELTRPAQWDFDSTGKIARLKAAATPDWIMVRRLTPYQELYTQFQDSSLLTAEQLNEAEKFGLYVNQEQFDGADQGFWNDPHQVITEPMQRAGLWPADGNDGFIGTTDAVSARLDPYVQDALPTPLALPEKEQEGKSWIDKGDLVQRYWDADAGAWVTLANTGPVGAPGTPGATGAKGEKGDPGPPLTIKGYMNAGPWTEPSTKNPGDLYIATGGITGFPGGGSPPVQGDAVVWSGTTWYNGGRIQGPVGPVGPQGLQGIQGERGEKGLQGDQGLTGPVGPEGQQGIQGLKGDKGDRGDVGPTGSEGPQGIQGVIGPIGPKGDPGPQGQIGPSGVGISYKGSLANAAGLAGITNPAPNDGYLTLDTGRVHVWTGSTWLDLGVLTGPQGPQGLKGDTGDQGIQGPQGSTGPAGPQGIQGVEGPIGPIGLTGSQGPAGATGATGPQGLKGDKGDTGSQGLKGDKGDTGSQGIQGPMGESMTSYWQKLPWKESTRPVVADFASVCWSPELGMFMAGAVNGTGSRGMSSTDGITWTEVPALIGGAFSAMCWSSALRLFVAISGAGSGRIGTSPDGVNWTFKAPPTNGTWSCVCWSPEKHLFVALGTNSSTDRCMTSPDGVNWTAHPLPAGAAPGNTPGHIVWSAEKGLFVAGGNSILLTSPDGTNWTLRPTASNESLSSICWAPGLGKFFATFSAHVTQVNTVRSSPDGINWTTIHTAPKVTSGIIWAAEIGLLIAGGTIPAGTGTSTAMHTSPDGANWTHQVVPHSANRNHLCWSPQLNRAVEVNNPPISFPGEAYAKLNTVQAFTKAQLGTPVVLADGATITPDFSLGNNFTLTILATGRTLANPTNLVAGQSGCIVITNSGAHTLAYGTAWKFAGGTKPTLTASATSVLTYYTVNSTTIVASLLGDVK